MRDRTLDRQLRLLTLQLDNWKKLHDLITYGLDKAKPIISSEQERQFTEIRANLLQETEYVFSELKVLAELSGKAMNVLQRGVSVRGIRELTNEDVRRLEMEWNTVFTKLGLAQGQLKARRKELAEQTAVGYYLRQASGLVFRRFAPAH
jgi:predicted NACHT family NTPase